MRGTFASFALIGALLLAGCTSTSGHPSGPAVPSTPGSTTTSVSPPAVTAPATVSDPPTQSAPAPTGTEVPADVPTTGPNLRHKGERPPVMPLLATRHTPAGAVAFAKFFIETIDWGFATTSGAYMRHYFEPSCIECENHASGLDATRVAKDRYIGGRFKISDAKLETIAQGTAERSVTVTFSITSGEVVDSRDRFVTGEPAHVGERSVLQLEWRLGTWTVANMVSTG